MEKVATILEQIAQAAMAAWSLPASRVFHDPTPVELPETGDYAAIRFELTAGRRETAAFDVMTLRVDVAAELDDPGSNRIVERMSLLGGFHERVTPWGQGLYPQIAGFEEPVMTEALASSIDDAPGRLLVACTIEGEVTLPRGGYEG